MRAVVPVLGVVLDGWDAGEMVLFFFAESAVIGAFNVPRILLARGKPGSDENPQDRTGFFTAPFFVVHFGLFVGVQWVFLRDMVPPDALWSPEFLRDLLIVAAFEAWDVAYHTIWHGQRHLISPLRQMFVPYPRIVIQQFVVLLGAWLAILGDIVGGTPAIAYLGLLITIRTAVDLLIAPVWVKALYRPAE